MLLPTPNAPSAEDGASSSPHPHHPPADDGDDEASGTSFDDLLAATIVDDTDNLEGPHPTNAAPTTAQTTALTTGTTTPIFDPSQPVITADVAGVTTASSDSVASSTGTNAIPPTFGDAAILTQSPPPPGLVVLTSSFSLDDSRASQRTPENYLASFQEAISTTEATLTGMDTDDPTMHRLIDGFQAAIAPLAAAYTAVQEEYDSRATSWYTMSAYFDDYKKESNLNLTALQQQSSTLQVENQRLEALATKTERLLQSSESKTSRMAENW